jgi:hypothetical protein
MAELFARRLPAALSTLLVASVGCTSSDARLEQHRRTLQSLTTSAAAIGDGWLSGHLTSRFAGTALERTFELVEQERQSLAGDPGAMAEAATWSLVQTADAESRAIALMARDITADDRPLLRQHLAQRAPADRGLR